MRARWLRLAVVSSLSLGLGCGFKYINPDVPEDRTWRRLRSARPAPRPAQRPAPAAASRPTAPRIVAVFDLEDRGAGLPAELRSRLSDYLAARLAALPGYQVVPRDRLRQRLARRQRRDRQRGKPGVDRACLGRSCQIDVGRELAAEAALSTVVMRLGSRCQVTAVLYDLRRAVAVGGGSAPASCEAESITTALDRVAGRLGSR